MCISANYIFLEFNKIKTNLVTEQRVCKFYKLSLKVHTLGILLSVISLGEKNLVVREGHIGIL